MNGAARCASPSNVGAAISSRGMPAGRAREVVDAILILSHAILQVAHVLHDGTGSLRRIQHAHIEIL